MVQRNFLSLLLIFFLGVCIADQADAAKKFQPAFVEDLFTLTDTNGEEVQCWENNQGVYRFAKIRERNGKLQVRSINYRTRIKKLREKARAAKSKRKKKKFKQKVKALRAEFNEKNAICALGPGSDVLPPGAPSPTPSIPAFFDLSPLERSITEQDLRYLAEKAGFGLGLNEEHIIEAAKEGGLSAAVDSFMSVREEEEGFLETAEDHLDNVLGQDRNQVWIQGVNQAWLYMMLNTKNSYRERFAWFLLSVWTTSAAPIDRNDQKFMMWDYVQKLRKASLESTTILELGKELTIDPLMLMYLSGDGNSAENPNENFARELLELFTTGPKDLDGNPNYTEFGGDITNFALALAGWQVGRISNQWISFFNPNRSIRSNVDVFKGTEHECRAATTLDASNAFRSVECAFQHPFAPTYYAKEILKYYLTQDPPRELIENFAEVIRENGWDLHASMKVLFNSKAFYNNSYQDAVVKDSVHYTIEFFRLTQIPLLVHGNGQLHTLLGRHQSPSGAPTVFWWPDEYKSSAPTLIEKHNTLVKFLRDATTKTDWTFDGALPADDAIDAADVIDYVVSLLGIELQSDDRAQLEFYMNHVQNAEGGHDEQAYVHSNVNHRRLKIRGLLNILLMHPTFHTA